VKVPFSAERVARAVGVSMKAAATVPVGSLAFTGSPVA
jgi:hypothetical protein